MEEITITREELYEKVWSTPLTQLAKELKISDVGLRKKCLKSNIPLPKAGHWSKVQHGRTTKKTPLPEEKENKPITLYIRDDNGVPYDPTIDERIKIKQEITTRYEEFIKPTVKLTKPHRLVQEVREHISGREANYEGHVCSDSSRYLSIAVSKQEIPQALRVFNSFIQLAEARGHIVGIKNRNTAITIDGIEIKIDVRERQKKVLDKSMSTYHDYYTKVASGILCFRMDELNKREWDDSKKSIEEQLPAIFASLEIHAEKERQWKIEAEKQRIKREAESRLRQEQYEIKLSEHNKVNSLIADSNRWNKAQEIRKYACHLEAIGTDKAVIEWARNKLTG